MLWMMGIGTSILAVNESESVWYDYDGVDLDELHTSSISIGFFPSTGIIVPISSNIECELTVRYDFIMYPTEASRISLMAGFYVLIV